jgi:hypothetical protein
MTGCGPLPPPPDILPEVATDGSVNAPNAFHLLPETESPAVLPPSGDEKSTASNASFTAVPNSSPPASITPRHPSIPPTEQAQSKCQLRLSNVAEYLNGMHLEKRLPNLPGKISLRQLSAHIFLITFSTPTLASVGLQLIQRFMREGTLASSAPIAFC